jgi:hypothetical protein
LGSSPSTAKVRLEKALGMHFSATYGKESSSIWAVVVVSDLLEFYKDAS